MPVAYHPQNFWHIIFTVFHSGVSEQRVWMRTLTVLPVSIGLALAEHYWEEFRSWETDGIIVPFTFLVSVITSFRLSDAYHKYERADGILTAMHSHCRETSSRLCAYVTPNNDDATDLALQIRRLLVLGCILIKEFVRGEKSDLLEEQSVG